MAIASWNIRSCRSRALWASNSLSSLRFIRASDHSFGFILCWKMKYLSRYWCHTIRQLLCSMKFRNRLGISTQTGKWMWFLCKQAYSGISIIYKVTMTPGFNTLLCVTHSSAEAHPVNFDELDSRYQCPLKNLIGKQNRTKVLFFMKPSHAA